MYAKKQPSVQASDQESARTLKTIIAVGAIRRKGLREKTRYHAFGNYEGGLLWKKLQREQEMFRERNVQCPTSTAQKPKASGSKLKTSLSPATYFITPLAGPKVGMQAKTLTPP